MEKEIIRTKIGESESFDSDYNDPSTPIGDLLAILIKAMEEGATHVRLTGYSYEGDCTSITITPVKEELESDELFQKRVSKWHENQKLDKERQEMNELETYKKLKQKFEHGK